MNDGLIVVLAMVAGAFVSSRLGGSAPKAEDRVAPLVWRQRFGETPYARYATVFLVGILMLFGARLAGGRTSGHMVSGMMQTSLSGYLFALGAIAAAVPATVVVYTRNEGV